MIDTHRMALARSQNPNPHSTTKNAAKTANVV